MKRYDRRRKYHVLLLAIILIAALTGWLLWGPVGTAVADVLSFLRLAERIEIVSACYRIGTGCYFVGGALVIGWVAAWCVHHQLRRGIRYALAHAKLEWRIRRALLEAPGYSVQQGNQEVSLPSIRITFDDDLTSGTVFIHNHPKWDTALEKLRLTTALGQYIVTGQWITDDGNWYQYDFLDSSVDTQYTFNSRDSLEKVAKENGDYQLFMDRRSRHIPLTGLLLVGAMGSGKSYALYGLIFQLLSWTVQPIISFADPKLSGLYIIGQRLAPERTATEEAEIISLLEDFHAKMQQRKAEMQVKLQEKIDADYRHWNLPAHVFVFDEYASFQSAIKDNKTLSGKLQRLMRDIVLQGRQLGFFAWVVMQKSDATDLSTAIRNSLLWKVVLGQAENTTYMTAFEHAADLPKRKFAPGQGLYSYQGRTMQPTITSFPTLNFDILGSLEPPEA